MTDGVLLSFGCAALLILKHRADKLLGSAERLAAEYSFIWLLILVAVTGLILYWSSGTGVASAALVIHLALVATFFIYMPNSKMAQGFFRLAA